MSTEADAPFIVVTAILNSAARPAAITMSHADALERAEAAAGDCALAGVDIVELTIAPKAFAALREHVGGDHATVAVYDVFPLPAKLEASSRTVAGQFLAAEVLWAMEAQGLLKGVPLNLRLDVPKDWDRDPKAVQERLLAAGALDLSAADIETYKTIKVAWDAAAPVSDAPVSEGSPAEEPSAEAAGAEEPSAEEPAAEESAAQESAGS